MRGIDRFYLGYRASVLLIGICLFPLGIRLPLRRPPQVSSGSCGTRVAPYCPV